MNGAQLDRSEFQSINSSIMRESIDETMYQWECTYCDHIVRAETSDEIQNTGRSHLDRFHRRELAELFEEKWPGNGCKGGCGNWFAADDGLDGFKCPDCGHDHFSYFAGEHVWWGIEEIE